MRKNRKKDIRRAVGFIALVALVAGLAAMPLLTADKVPDAEFPLSTLSAEALERELLLDLRSGGTLSEEEAATVTVPKDVKLTGFLVSNGDTVKAGDPIATVDRVTVMTAIATAQEAMEDLAAKLEKERGASSTDTLKAPGGLVKKIYAQPGDSVEDVMLHHGALATLSLDGLMQLELTLEVPLPEGQLRVLIEGETLNATVISLLDGTVTVTFQDKGFEEGTEAVLLDAQANELGRGGCAIHAPWNAVAYSGTISSVSAKEGQTLYEGASILSLKDIPYSAEYRSLAAQHRGYEEQMLELFQLYQTLTLTAPCDGIVSGIDENSAQLLQAQGDWRIDLLKNAPGKDPDTEYINFVGWVKAQGSDGYIVALDPTLFSHTDYLDLSDLPRDTTTMTHEAVYLGGAPVYSWDGKEWQERAFAVGDLLLFGGDSSGSVVWIIPYGHADAPGEEPSEPTVPTEPSEPSDPTEPSEPTDPTVPSIPTDPTVPSEPGGDGPGDNSGNGGGNKPGWPGGFPGGITIPSFGGYGNYTIPGAQQDLPVTDPDEVTVATVTPQDTMTLQMPVDELDLHLIRVGQEAQVTLEALGSTFPATVTSLSRAGTSLGGNSKFLVTLTLERQEDMLPGMNGAVSVPLETVRGIAIPVAALRQEGSKLFVCTALDPKTGEPASPVEVRTGFSDGEYVLVEGLEAGDTVWYSYYEALEE